MDSIMLTHGTCDAQAAICDGAEFGHLGDQMDTIKRLMEIFTKAASVRTVPPTRNGILNSMKPKQMPCIDLPTSNNRPVMCNRISERSLTSARYINTNTIGTYSTKLPCALTDRSKAFSP